MRIRMLGAGLLCGAMVLAGACVSVSVNDENNGNSSANGSPNGSPNGSSTGKSGISTSKRAQEFTEQEEQSFCEWTVDQFAGAEGEYDCGDGIVLTVENVDVASCEQFLADNPDCPVPLLEDCFVAASSDLCAIIDAPECTSGLSDCASVDVNGDPNIDPNFDPNIDPNIDPNSSTEYCYDHDCNGDATGEQCFDNFEDYCDSLCFETNCISVAACEAECL